MSHLDLDSDLLTFAGSTSIKKGTMHDGGPQDTQFVKQSSKLGNPFFNNVMFSVTRRSRSDVRQWVSEWVSQATDRDFTDVTPDLRNVNFFTQSKSYESNFTPRKARKSQQI